MLPIKLPTEIIGCVVEKNQKESRQKRQSMPLMQRSEHYYEEIKPKLSKNQSTYEDAMPLKKEVENDFKENRVDICFLRNDFGPSLYAIGTNCRKTAAFK